MRNTLLATTALFVLTVLIGAVCLLQMSRPYCINQAVENVLSLREYSNVSYSSVKTILADNNYKHQDYPDEKITVFICQRPVLKNIGFSVVIRHDNGVITNITSK